MITRKRGFFIMETSGISKARYWVGVLYPENMIEDWQDKIDDLVQVPYAYCIHFADIDTVSEHRKDHVHLILAFNNTTTYNHVFKIFNLLSAHGKKAINKCEAVISIRQKYEYLIHNTAKCKKEGKYLYPAEARITGNNFDIGLFEQLSQAEKNKMCKELADVIIEKEFTNFTDFYIHVMLNFPDEYFDILKSNNGFLERLTKGNYQRKSEQEKNQEREFSKAVTNLEEIILRLQKNKDEE